MGAAAAQAGILQFCHTSLDKRPCRPRRRDLQSGRGIDPLARPVPEGTPCDPATWPFSCSPPCCWAAQAPDRAAERRRRPAPCTPSTRCHRSSGPPTSPVLPRARKSVVSGKRVSVRVDLGGGHTVVKNRRTK